MSPVAVPITIKEPLSVASELMVKSPSLTTIKLLPIMGVARWRYVEITIWKYMKFLRLHNTTANANKVKINFFFH